ncbi:transglycosylase SLT domain-containing protein [Nocardia alni]|uniref:aggregation-promoting factor C-terminal-like domain-containing protein n=1 Tax=Nocardia alni TaxID=2815723 RepID=UPI001C23B236|nr:transglycosylase SLT domain-containing protein [Nocardia alni]
MPRMLAVVLAASAVWICAGPAIAEDLMDDGIVTPAGLAMSAVRDGARLAALTIVPLPQFPSFDKIVTRESGWNIFATNPVSGAYGIGQALPPEKMATHGPDWRFNPMTQIRWTYDYMNERYGSPDRAWQFWQAHHWY